MRKGQRDRVPDECFHYVGGGGSGWDHFGGVCDFMDNEFELLFFFF